ncbi:hypothetical protein V1511DRAFT_512817 [Dipodascopsis uninucleata]
MGRSSLGPPGIPRPVSDGRSSRRASMLPSPPDQQSSQQRRDYRPSLNTRPMSTVGGQDPLTPSPQSKRHYSSASTGSTSSNSSITLNNFSSGHSHSEQSDRQSVHKPAMLVPSVSSGPNRRDSSESDVGKKTSGNFMGGIFHLGRKSKDKQHTEDASHGHSHHTPAPRVVSKYSPYTGNNLSDTHLIQHNRFSLAPYDSAGQESISSVKSTRQQSSTPSVTSYLPSSTAYASSSISPVSTNQPISPDKPSKKIMLLCTTDHEHFILINITGISSPSVIRQSIAEKLGMDVNKHVQLHITDFGETENGDPLADEDLLNQFKRGDAKIVIKLFVRLRQSTSFPPDATYKPISSNVQQLVRRSPVEAKVSLRVNTDYNFLSSNSSEFIGGHKLLNSTKQQQQQQQQQLPVSSQNSQYTQLEEVTLPEKANIEIKKHCDNEQNFKLVQQPAPFIDFNKGRQSPYPPRAFTAHRSPPPPPSQSQIRSSSLKGRSCELGPPILEANRRVSSFVPTQSNSLEVPPSNDFAIKSSFPPPTPRKWLLPNSNPKEDDLASSPNQNSIVSPLSTPVTSRYSHIGLSNDSKRNSDLGLKDKEKHHLVPRKSLASAAEEANSKLVEGDSEKDTENSADRSNPSISAAFEENEISFADAPKFPSFDDTSENDDEDDGLWAMKPPTLVPSSEDGNISSLSQTPAVPTSILSPSAGSSSTNQETTSTKSQRPVLHVQIGNTEVIDTQPLSVNSAFSPTDRVHETLVPTSVVSTSPASAVGDLPNIPFRNNYSQLHNQTKLDEFKEIYETGDVWAVRPPAEIVYDNLEKFFPNTDLDKPIIYDTPIFASSSPSTDNSEYSSGISPFDPTPDYEDVSDKESEGTKNEHTNLDRGFSFKSSSHSGSGPVEERIDVSQKARRPTLIDVVVQPGAPFVQSSVNNEDLKSPAKTTVNRSGGIVRNSRMKSLRIVAREASDARKNLKMAQNGKQIIGNDGNKALLRRKSTKMWGQRVVEVIPGQIKRGQLSVTRRPGQPQQFNWVKGELIGKGTFGRVYLALNVTTGEMMAVKQVGVPQTSSDNDSTKQREVVDALNSEIQTMKDLDHLNIVQYLGYEALPDVCSLFLEYVPGGSIGTCLRKHGRFELSVIRSITRQVVDGLAYLHSRSILHRDLKSDNLLLDLDGVCKISDFGISKRSQNIYSNDAEMSMQGTIFWMAPEVIHNVVHNEKQGYSAKVDIWSLGCVVLEMFAGRRPWSNDEAIGAMYKLGNAKLAPPIPEDTVDYVPEDGKVFLDDCFTINPEMRPTAEVLLQSKFCVPDTKFNFDDTNLARLIRFDDKRKEHSFFT